MREIIALVEAAIPGGETYWFNPSNDDVITVGDHGEGVMEHPYRFGIDRETVYQMIMAFPDGCDEYETPDDDTDCDDLPPPPSGLNPDRRWHRNDAWEQLAINRGWVRCGEAVQARRYISAATAEAAWAAAKFTTKHHYISFLDIEITGQRNSPHASLFASLDDTQLSAFVKAGPRRALEFLQSHR